jgi:DNA-binding SARP family transcriptional activator/tetratricopeptide (TPR) repeat protein
MEFRILGPLEVWAEGDRKLDLAGKQRALLAILLLHANKAVSTDRLIDELWDGEPPETADKALHVYVSRLRKLLGRERVQTAAPGYLLRVEPGELDLARFEQLQRDGRLHEALALWRGSPLADVAHERFAQGEIARLEELRLACLEERIEQDLDAGRHTEVIGELEALVAEHPLRERLRAQLMLALYRARRQAEALTAYQAARRALVDELGLEPSPELQELERRILRQDPSLDVEAAAPPPVTAPAPAGAPRRRAAGTFVAREWELATLEAGLDDAFAGRGRLFLLVGEAGIGKSRLADEFAARAKQRGALILWGRCWEAGGAPAYWPWVQSLRTYLRTRHPEALRDELRTGASELAQLLPELDELYPDLPPLATLDPDSARFRLFDSVAGFVRNAARAQTIVLVLDDLHAADEPSLLLLRFLAGELAEMPVVVVGTYREEEATEEEPVSASLSELRRLPSRHLRLGGLAAEHVATYIELATGVTPPASLVEAIYTETEGNPLFVGEVVRLLAAEGRLSKAPEPGWRLQIPPGLHEVIARRLRRLSKDCRRLLTLASVLGREFSLDALERVSDSTDDELLDVLDEAFAARVLADVPGAVGRVRFSHARVRDALYDDMSIARRAQLHHRIGQALEELYGADPDPYLAELAHHFFLAGPRGDVDKTIEYTRRAGDRAVALLAYEEAVRHYEMALRAFERRAIKDDRGKCELRLALGDALAKAGRMDEAKEAFIAAADRARAAGLAEDLARAALGYGGRFVWSRAWGDTRLVPLLEEALDALPEEDSELRVRLLARLAAGPLRDSLAPEPRRAMAQEAVEIARRLGEPTTLAYALEGRYETYWGPDRLEERLAIANELIGVAEDAGDAERAYAGHSSRFFALLEAGDLPAAYRDDEAATRLAHELRQPAQLWDTVVRGAQLALFEGRFEEAENAIHEALEVGRLAQSANARMAFDLQMYALRREQDRLAEVRDVVQRAVEDYPAYPVWRFVSVDVLAQLGRKDDARAALDKCAADEFRLYVEATAPYEGELEMQWLFSLSLLPEACRYLGDAEAAAALYELLQPYAHLNATTAPELCLGSVARGLGILASVMSNFEQAAEHFEYALERNSRMGARPWAAHTQYDYASMLSSRDAPGDADRARELLDSCLATCRELGMEALDRRAAGLTAVRH